MLSKELVLQFLASNKQKGLIGERIAMEDYQENGFKIISTRIGSDFIACKEINGRLYQEYVEVKTGNSRQSLAQKKKMRELRRKRISYTIYRVTEKFLSHYISSQAETGPSYTTSSNVTAEYPLPNFDTQNQDSIKKTSKQLYSKVRGNLT